MVDNFKNSSFTDAIKVLEVKLEIEAHEKPP